MKKLSTLTLTGPGSQQLVEKGKLTLGKGRLMQGIRCLMTIPLKNASGSSRALTADERAAFIEGHSVKLSYGAGLKRSPYNMLTLKRMRLIARFLYGSDWEGYSNTLTGLARTLNNGATTTVQLYVTLPTGRLRQLRERNRLFGVGRTQALGMQLEWHRKMDVLPTGFSVDGNILVDIIPDDVSRRGPEQFQYLPEWCEVDETDKRAYLPKGCVLLVTERSAPLAASVLSDVAAFVDQEELYTNLSVQTAYTPFLDLPAQSAEGDVSDMETVLYQVDDNMELRDYLSGVFRLEQITKTLGTTKLGGLIMPIPGEDEVGADLQVLAGKNGRNKTLKCINADAFHGLGLPHTVVPYLPMVVVDTDDKEFQRFPGRVSQGGQPAEIFVPASVVGNARGLRAAATSNSEPYIAEDVVRQVALAIPGAGQDSHGFSRTGSTTLTAVRGVVG